MQNSARPAANRQKAGEYATFALMLGLFLAGIAIVVRFTDFSAASMTVNLFLTLSAMTFTLLLYFFCANGFTWDMKEKHLFEIMVFFFFLYSLATLLADSMVGRPELRQIVMPLYTVLYPLSSLYWLSFWFFQRNKAPLRAANKVYETLLFIFFSVYTLVALVNHFTGFCFTVDADGNYVVRSLLLYYLSLLWFVIYFIIAATMRCERKTKLTLMSYSFFPMVSWLLFIPLRDSVFYFNIFSGLSTLLYLVPLYLLFFNIYLERWRLQMQRETELELSRANAMMLQISPHFIANTMSSIVALCDPGAPEAGALAAKFARYLRDNYADMSEDALIPFYEELEHIRNYLAIEEVRFPGLRTEYDIQSESFYLPTLTVQPLVENAVRHGISKRPDASGTVKIASFEKSGSYVIRITDDGVGFRPEERRDGKHIGVANAKARLSMLCDGTLTITSQVGQGTVCEIRIPIRRAKS